MMVLFFIMMAQMVIMTMPRALECCSRVQNVLDHSPEIVDYVNADPQIDEKNNQVLAFDHVTFRFADAEEDTLSDLNFTCRRAQTTAIIGGTGSGKSTVASLILRFHDVSSGSIRLNGTDIRDMTQQKLRDHIAYVQQKAWLFSDTIADNLRYSNADASDEDLMHAAEVAQAADFIRAQPQGLQAFVAQRVSTIRHADQIIVLHEGKMAGIGTHDELLKTCSVYQEIYTSQTKEAKES